MARFARATVPARILRRKRCGRETWSYRALDDLRPALATAPELGTRNAKLRTRNSKPFYRSRLLGHFPRS